MTKSTGALSENQTRGGARGAPSPSRRAASSRGQGVRAHGGPGSPRARGVPGSAVGLQPPRRRRPPPVPQCPGRGRAPTDDGRGRGAFFLLRPWKPGGRGLAVGTAGASGACWASERAFGRAAVRGASQEGWRGPRSWPPDRPTFRKRPAGRPVPSAWGASVLSAFRPAQSGRHRGLPAPGEARHGRRPGARMRTRPRCPLQRPVWLLRSHVKSARDAALPVPQTETEPSEGRGLSGCLIRQAGTSVGGPASPRFSGNIRGACPGHLLRAGHCPRPCGHGGQ